MLIEQTFGRLKRRWSILHQELRVTPDKAAKIFCAAATLHNLAIDRNVPDHFDDLNDDYEQPIVQPYNGPDNNGSAFRTQLTASFFT